MSEEHNQPNNPERRGNEVFGGQQQRVVSEPTWSDIPFEMVPLPSAGTIYPPTSPLNKAHLDDGKIAIKVMTAREEDILTNQAYLKTGKVIEELLRACMMNKEIDVNDMIAGDRNAVMVAIRMIGYDRWYPGMVECGRCEHEWENTFDLAELSIKRLEIKPVEEGENLFSYTLPKSGHRVLFKFLTGKDEEEMEVVAERRKKLGHRGESRVTDRLQYAIVEFEGTRKKQDIVKAIDRMRALDSTALRKYMAKHEPGMDMGQEVVCESCGHRQEVSMPIGVKFFYPDPIEDDIP